MHSLVSILIPAYNSQAFIADTIESALAQTWSRKEIIIVDDGSTDMTLKIAKKFASKAVSVVGQANKGASAARNKAFSLCQGDFIQWLDADDLLAPEKIAMQMQALNYCSGPRSLLSCPWGRFLYRPRKARFLSSSLWCDLSPSEYLLRKMEGNVFMQTTNWLVSRELTQAAGPWDTRLSLDDDGEHFCRVLLASDGVRFVPEAKSYYRLTGFGSLSALHGAKLESQFLSCKLQVGYAQLLASGERVRSACLTYLEKYISDFYPERLDLVEQMQQLAAGLGGRLVVPALPMKYAWIEKLFGNNLAKRAQTSYNKLKLSALKSWDKTLLNCEKLTNSKSSGPKSNYAY